jgi:hypothetical protein
MKRFGKLLKLISIGPIAWAMLALGISQASMRILVWGVIIMPGMFMLVGYGIEKWGEWKEECNSNQKSERKNNKRP